MDKFPLQFPRDPATGARCRPLCLSGWFGIIDSLCGTVQAYCDHTFLMATTKNGKAMSICPPQVVWNQIKEKLGTGRFYYEIKSWPIHVIKACEAKIIRELTLNVYNTVEGMVLFAEHLTEKTCERCGEPGNPVERKGYLAVRCPDCTVEEGFTSSNE